MITSWKKGGKVKKDDFVSGSLTFTMTSMNC